MATIQKETTVREPGSNGQLSGQSTAMLVRALAEQAQRLVREEVRLAKLEIKQDAAKAGRNASMIAGGAVVLHAGFLILCFAVVFGLAQAMSLPRAALLIAVLLMGAGAALGWRGMRQLKEIKPKPTRTIETIKEDRRWAKQTMHEVRSRMRANA